MIAWAGAERLALGLTDTLDTRPHARWPLGDVKGPPVPPVAAVSAEPAKNGTPPEAEEPQPQ